MAFRYNTIVYEGRNNYQTISSFWSDLEHDEHVPVFEFYLLFYEGVKLGFCH